MIHALWRDGVVYAAGTVLSRGIALLLLPLVTRVLSPAEYGALDMIVTIGVLINLVVPLETSQALARFWNERAEGAPRRRTGGHSLHLHARRPRGLRRRCALCRRTNRAGAVR